MKDAPDRIDRDVEATMDNMGLFLTVLAIVLTILGLLGLGGVAQNIVLGRKASEALSDAQESALQVATIKGDAEEALNHVQAIRQGLSEVWHRADLLAMRMPVPEKSWMLRVDTPDVDPETEVAWRDLEGLLVWADRLAISADSTRTAAHYLDLAHSWRQFGHFPNSVVRAQRSIELDDSNWVAYRALADALSLWVEYDVDFEFLAGDKEKEAQFKSGLLSRALSAAQDAEQRWDGEDPICLNSLGWVYDTMGKTENNKVHHETAVNYFKKADELAKKRRDDSGAAYDSTYLFNMMCALVGAGGDENFDKVIKVAEELATSSANMEKRLLDPDLEPILSVTCITDTVGSPSSIQLTSSLAGLLRLLIYTALAQRCAAWDYSSSQFYRIVTQRHPIPARLSPFSRCSLIQTAYITPFQLRGKTPFGRYC